MTIGDCASREVFCGWRRSGRCTFLVREDRTLGKENKKRKKRREGGGGGGGGCRSRETAANGGVDLHTSALTRREEITAHSAVCEPHILVLAFVYVGVVFHRTLFALRLTDGHHSSPSRFLLLPRVYTLAQGTHTLRRTTNGLSSAATVVNKLFSFVCARDCFLLLRPLSSLLAGAKGRA